MNDSIRGMRSFSVFSLFLLFPVGNTSNAQLAGGTWTSTGPMFQPRGNSTATRLLDGRVLIAGGCYSARRDGCPPIPWAELYDPDTQTFSSTLSMAENRRQHTATLLEDGRVLVTGGILPVSGLSSAELFNPKSGNWSCASPMTAPRWGHTATRLSDGRVLIAGGSSVLGPVASAEIYDPLGDTWKNTGNMSRPRASHASTSLSDGRVLVVSGNTAEIYDPERGIWTRTGDLATAWFMPKAFLLLSGQVLVFDDSNRTPELYDPKTNTWRSTGSRLENRPHSASALLNDGRVLVAGGNPFTGFISLSLSSAEVYDPDIEVWTRIAFMDRARADHSATVLEDGRVLVAGGFSLVSCDGGCIFFWVAEGGLYTP